MGRKWIRNPNNEHAVRSAEVPNCPLTGRTSGVGELLATTDRPRGEGARAWARQASKGVQSTATPDLVPRHADRLSLTQGCTGFDTQELRVSYGQTQPLPRVLQTKPLPLSYGQTTLTTCFTNTTPTTILRTNTTLTTCLTPQFLHSAVYNQLFSLPSTAAYKRTPVAILCNTLQLRITPPLLITISYYFDISTNQLLLLTDCCAYCQVGTELTCY